MNLPNWISAARIAICPLVFHLALSPGAPARYAAFGLFVVAAVSDLWDGYLARKHDWVTDTGKLLDPIADKALLASTFVPAFIVSRRPEAVAEAPWWGVPLPMWVMVVVFGREIAVTLFRGYAARRGRVIPADALGKRKALAQNFFVGGLFLWYPLLLTAAERGWSGSLWRFWRAFHSAWIGVTLALAVGLSVLSLARYLWRYRTPASSDA